MIEQTANEGDPQGNREDQPRVAENTPAAQMPNGATEEIEHERDGEKWGSLPEYAGMLQKRGSQPEVPERYRKYRDAFLKRAQNK